MLYIDRTNHTPLISVNQTTNTITFEGESRPENVKKFYDPVVLSLIDYLTNCKNETKVVVDFKFEYLNSTSIKCIYDILVLLEKHANRLQIKANWYYLKQDELMQENGVDYANLVPNLKLNTIELA